MIIKPNILIFFGILLAALGFYFQNTSPIFGSIFALSGATLFLIVAKKLTNERRNRKAEKRKNKR